MLYNLASLALGLVSWAMGVISIPAFRHKSLYQFSSFTCCCTALLLQFYEIKRRCAVDDWVGVDDTISAVSLAASVLVLVTVGLNILSNHRKKGVD